MLNAGGMNQQLGGWEGIPGLKDIFNQIEDVIFTSFTLWLCQNIYWIWLFIVDKNPLKMVIFHSYASLPEGSWTR